MDVGRLGNKLFPNLETDKLWGYLPNLGKLEMHRILLKIKVVKLTTFRGKTKRKLKSLSLRA